MTPLTPAVQEKIEILFLERDHAAAARLLEERCGENLPLSSSMGPHPSGFDRIRFAVLKLSGGDLPKLRREVEGACVDWRDTLVAAGFGDDVTAHLSWNPRRVH